MGTLEPMPPGPPWLQTLASVLGLLGGASGVAAVAAVLTQRRKLNADAADVLTDTALILVQPLKQRIAELEAETTRARQQAEQAHHEIRELRIAVRSMTSMMRRWRAAIFAPDATIEGVRKLIDRDDPLRGNDSSTEHGDGPAGQGTLPGRTGP